LGLTKKQQVAEMLTIAFATFVKSLIEGIDILTQKAIRGCRAQRTYSRCGGHSKYARYDDPNFLF
jgi:hypothetical protein